MRAAPPAASLTGRSLASEAKAAGGSEDLSVVEVAAVDRLGPMVLTAAADGLTPAVLKLKVAQ